MSHIVTIQARLRDREAIAAACRRLGLAPPADGTAQLFNGECSGLIVQLPSWRYPVVIDLNAGGVQFDNYGGVWGEETYLNGFLQAYSVERTKMEARRRGLAVHEQLLQDGSIRLQIMNAS